MNYMKRFQQGDLVSYTGDKFIGELTGKLGQVVARIGNTDSGVVVDFGTNSSYILDENNHLKPFQGKMKSSSEEEGSEKKEKGIDMESRKGISKRKKGSFQQFNTEED